MQKELECALIQKSLCFSVPIFGCVLDHDAETPTFIVFQANTTHVDILPHETTHATLHESSRCQVCGLAKKQHHMESASSCQWFKTCQGQLIGLAARMIETFTGHLIASMLSFQPKATRGFC